MISKILRYIGIVGIIVSFALLGTLVIWQNEHPTYELSRIVGNADNGNESIATNVDENNVSYDVSNISEINSASDLAADAKRSEPVYLKSYLKIPELGVDLKIYEGLGKKALSKGAGTIRENMKPDKLGVYAIAAHNLHDFDEGHGFSKFQKYREQSIGKKAYLSDGEYIYTYNIVDNKSLVKTDTMKYTDDDWVNQFYTGEIIKYPQYAGKTSVTKEYTKEGNYKEVAPENKVYAPFISFYTCDVEKQGKHWVSGNRILTIGILTDKVKFVNAPLALKKLFFDTTNGDESLLTESESVAVPDASVETVAESKVDDTHVEKVITFEKYTGKNIVFNYINSKVSSDINYVVRSTKICFIMLMCFIGWYILFNILIIDID